MALLFSDRLLPSRIDQSISKLFYPMIISLWFVFNASLAVLSFMKYMNT